MSKPDNYSRLQFNQTAMFAALVMVVICWHQFGQPWLVETLTQPSNHPLMAQVWRTIFPNLELLLSRLSHDQLAEKLNQVLVRLVAVVIVGYLLLRKDYRYPLFKKWTAIPFIQPTNGWFYLIGFGVLWFGYDIASDLFLRVQLIDTAYLPPSLFALLVTIILPKPTEWPIIIWSLLLLSGTVGWLLFSLKGIKPQAKLIGKVAFILLMIGQLWLYSFLKIDHTFATFNWVAWVVLWQPSALTSRLALVAILLTYGLAGVEKLLISGISWSDAESISNYLTWHATSTGLALLPYPWLVSLLSSLALLLQLSSFAILKWPQLMKVWVISMVAFHWGTWLLFGAGAWIHPWFWGLAYVWHQLTKPTAAQASEPVAA